MRHSQTTLDRALCVEREWSADGETEVGRAYYTRVRFVPVYDAAAILALPRWPADLTPYQTGTIAQPY